MIQEIVRGMSGEFLYPWFPCAPFPKICQEGPWGFLIFPFPFFLNWPGLSYLKKVQLFSLLNHIAGHCPGGQGPPGTNERGHENALFLGHILKAKQENFIGDSTHFFRQKIMERLSPLSELSIIDLPSSHRPRMPFIFLLSMCAHI